MICIISGNRKEAELFASAQNWEPNEWFFPSEPEELNRFDNFHVLVIGTAGEHVPSSYFNRLYTLAQTRGKRNRK